MRTAPVGFCTSHLAALRPTIWRPLEAAASLSEASVQYPPDLDDGVASCEATAVPLGKPTGLLGAASGLAYLGRNSKICLDRLYKLYRWSC